MRNHLIILCFLISNTVFSQEVLSDLYSISYLSEKEFTVKQNKLALTLPFIDDFSYPFTQPDNNLWNSSSVFINRSYPINPPTIGVATFDGLNSNGRANNMTFTGTDSENADTLTSQQIDLSNIDTAYFMFYYQAQGNGNDPQTTDSLILEFSAGTDSLGNEIWNTIWKKEGSAFHEFKKFVYVLAIIHKPSTLTKPRPSLAASSTPVCPSAPSPAAAVNGASKS